MKKLFTTLLLSTLPLLAGPSFQKEKVANFSIFGEHTKLTKEQNLTVIWDSFYDKVGFLDFLKLKGKHVVGVYTLGKNFEDIKTLSIGTRKKLLSNESFTEKKYKGGLYANFKIRYTEDENTYLLQWKKAFDTLGPNVRPSYVIEVFTLNESGVNEDVTLLIPIVK